MYVPAIFIFLVVLIVPVSLADEDVRSFFDAEHEYLMGLVPSLTLNDPVSDNFYGMPGMYQEFKVELAGGSFQCFYQNLQKGSKLFVFFEVMRGADTNINVEIIQPSGLALKSFQWTNRGDLDLSVPTDGIHSFCLDNRLSRFSSKIVTLYLHTFFEDQWEEMNLDLNEVSNRVSNFLKSFSVIDGHVSDMRKLGRLKQYHLIKDWYLIRDNNSFVQKASIFLCIFFIVVSVTQTIFMKKLFATPTKKPRV